MIGSQLDHRTLLSLSLTARPVFEALRTSLEQEKAIRRQYRHIDVCSDIPGPLPYHSLLFRLVQDDRLAGYVVDLRCGEDIDLGDDDLSEEEERQRAESLPEFNEKSRALLEKRIEHMSWFSEEQRTRSFQRLFAFGGESVVLSLLLCMLGELRFLCPPQDWGDNVQKLVESITSGAQTQALSDASDKIKASDSKPLQKLQIFRGHTSNGVHGVELEDALAWMNLPSLRRVILHRCRTEWFREDIEPSAPLIKAPDIYLTESCVTLNSITHFAKFIQAPCTIRQTFGTAGEYHDIGPLVWDHCEISKEGSRTGAQKVNIELRYPASELHQDYDPKDNTPRPESPAFYEMGSEEDLGDWTKIGLPLATPFKMAPWQEHLWWSQFT